MGTGDPGAVADGLLVAAARLTRWVENFTARHGETRLSVEAGRLHGRARDGSWFAAAPPFGRSYAGPVGVDGLVAACEPPESWGLILVRKGGFAVALLAGSRVVASKVGRRHVQGRTKAGGQSQQRFARRRDNQARQAYGAAAEHAVGVLEPLLAGTAPVLTGGDQTAVAAVLADPRLRRLRVLPGLLSVPDPRRRVLEHAIEQACSARMNVVNAGP